MTERDSDRFFVLTGGPGSGKTTLLDRLAACEGMKVMAEAGRAIIRDQVAIGGKALPWNDRAAYAELMLASDMRSHREARAQPGIFLFDRAVPDVIGYLMLCGLPIPQHVESAGRLFRYSTKVFVAPPWRDVYETDEERKQSFETAEATHDAMVEVYCSLGYELIELPRASIKDRIALVQGIVTQER